MHGHRRLGWVPDIPDIRDHRYAVPYFKDLPERVDLRPGFPAVYDQGDLGSCTAQAIAAAIAYDQKKQGLPEVTPSRLFIYYQERLMEGTVDQDSGAMIRDGIKACDQFGVAPEPLWPYVTLLYRQKPIAAAYEEALQHQILQYARVPQDRRSLMATMAAGYPIVFGFSVYESFMSDAVAATGVVPMPTWGERLLGGHAVDTAGYEPNGPLCRNSWNEWGDHGYFTLPWEYILDPNLADDFWVIRLIEGPGTAPAA